MKQATRRRLSAKPSIAMRVGRWLREGVLLLSVAGAFFLSAALFTYQKIGISAGSLTEAIHSNAGGKAGYWLAHYLSMAVGHFAYVFGLMLVYSAWLWLRRVEGELDRPIFVYWVGFLLMTLGMTGLASLSFGAGDAGVMLSAAGGALGRALTTALLPFLNTLGTALLLGVFFLLGITLGTGISWFKIVDGIGRIFVAIFAQIRASIQRGRDLIAEHREVQTEDDAAADDSEGEYSSRRKRPVIYLPPHAAAAEENEDLTAVEEMLKRVPAPLFAQKTATRIEMPPAPKIKSSTRAQRDRTSLPLFDAKSLPEGLPSLSLLDPPERRPNKSYSHAVLEAMSRNVEARLSDFGIQVQVVAVHPGPVITRFELQLAAGIKVSKITALSKDLARSLSVTSVRVVEVIAGKSVVGLELPNEEREIVRLSEVLSSQQYEQARSPLSLALGKDIAGHPVIVDLAKMPHLLVAGTTGSGKSVGLNAMLLSLLYKSTPETVRLIMIDPKMLELSSYEGIPHLLAPVVTDMREAANALRWCVAEMDRRYRLMAALGVRNLSTYNTKVREAEKSDHPLLDPLWKMNDTEEPQPLRTMPYIVVLIDEFADMMMVVGKKVEELIARISQKARAAGIHMILATQRPSVDVITGLIKANVPTRIAFQVSSRIDSRTILDQQGAEQLIGHGDMLYLAPGTGLPVRVHGAFVADHEVHKVVEDWRRRGSPEYIDAILEANEDAEGGSDGGVAADGVSGEQDPLYDQAVQIVIDTRRASISHLQRRLKIGYNRAACLIEEMERAGIVSAMEGAGAREVLVPAQEE